MRNYAIVTAAGKGTRFGSNKALYPLLGKPLLVWSLEVFSKVVDEIWITCPENFHEEYRVAGSGFHNVNFISGGETRYKSVRRAFEVLGSDGIVLIHDAARPLLSRDLVERVMRATTEYGAAIPVLPVTDTVKEVEDERIIRTVPREHLYLAQTPQGFRCALLKDAYSKVEGTDLTDEAMIVELAGHPVHCVPGERTNLKITEPSDIALAEFYLQKETLPASVGSGIRARRGQGRPRYKSGEP